MNFTEEEIALLNKNGWSVNRRTARLGFVEINKVRTNEFDLYVFVTDEGDHSGTWEFQESWNTLEKTMERAMENTACQHAIA